MGFGIHIHLNLSPELKWVGNAVKTAGKPIGAVAHAVQGAEGAVGKEIGKLPVIGKPLHAIFDLAAVATLGPMLTVGDVLSGKNISQAVMGPLKEALQDVKEVAPYAEMVIGFIPGLGTGVDALLGAGLALASGQSITTAMEDGIKDAIPGGAIAVAVYQVAKAGVQMAKTHRFTLGDIATLGGAAASALGVLPTDMQTELQNVLGPVGDAVNGAKEAIGQAETALPGLNRVLSAEARKALQIGVAVGHGSLIQATAMPGLTDPGLRNRLMAQGQQIAATDLTVQAARSTLHGGYNGFDVGVGLMRMAVTPHQFQVIRAFFQGPDLVGFDLAASLHIARVAQPTPALGSTPANAGYLATLGMQGAPDASKTAIMQGIATQPVIAGGAKAAVSHVAERRASWWARIVAFFTGQKHVLA